MREAANERNREWVGANKEHRKDILNRYWHKKSAIERRIGAALRGGTAEIRR